MVNNKKLSVVSAEQISFLDKHNQENILFLENKEIAQRYTEAFNYLFDTFKYRVHFNFHPF